MYLLQPVLELVCICHNRTLGGVLFTSCGRAGETPGATGVGLEVLGGSNRGQLRITNMPQ
jgi:hypothetical protein